MFIRENSASKESGTVFPILHNLKEVCCGKIFNSNVEILVGTSKTLHQTYTVSLRFQPEALCFDHDDLSQGFLQTNYCTCSFFELLVVGKGLSSGNQLYISQHDC